MTIRETTVNPLNYAR